MSEDKPMDELSIIALCADLTDMAESAKIGDWTLDRPIDPT